MNRKENILQYTVQVEDSGKRIRAILRGNFGFSRTLVRKLKKTENVLLNGKPALMKDQVQTGDVLQIKMDLPEETRVKPEKIPFEILFENEDLMVINKPAGLVVHPTGKYPGGTLANAVIHHWQQQGHNRIFRPVHRLDKDTSGVIIVAKNHYAHQHLSNQIKLKILSRRYIAVVEGILKEDKGTIDEPIGRDPQHSVKRKVGPGGQKAVTHFKVLKRLNNATLVKLKLETGRTHQIRVHMAHIGHPILGDSLYGGSTELIKRQALHSREVQFLNPRTGKKIVVKSSLPDDIKSIIMRHSSSLS